MSSKSSATISELAGRLKELEHFTRGAGRPEPDAVPINEAAPMLVPVPRRSRIFLRHGEGHGAFADLTLTAPLPRVVTD